MEPLNQNYTFGPVPSRRLGMSLGINNIPTKTCTYSCIYCQVGRTTRMQADRVCFYDPEDICRNVRSRLAKAKEAGVQVDYLTFVPDGEPTLDLNLGKEILWLRELGIPVGVITNSSLIARADVREELAKADWVSLKIDTAREDVWRAVDRPHGSLLTKEMLDGLRKFAASYQGKLVTETMLIRGMNDDDESLKLTAGFLGQLRPRTAYLSIPTRPPAESWVRPPTEEAVNLAYQIFSDKLQQVELLVGYEGNAFASTGNVQNDLMSITSVHPMREEAVNHLLIQAGSSRSVVDRLVAQGELAETRYHGHTFYLRKFKNKPEATR